MTETERESQERWALEARVETAEAEVERLRDENDVLRLQCHTEIDVMWSLEAENERLRGLLQEWSSLAFKQVIGPPLCPLCYGRGEQYDTIQHKPDCLFERTRKALEDDHA